MTDQPQAPTPPSDIKYYSTGGGDPGVHARRIIEFMQHAQPTCFTLCNRMSVPYAMGACKLDQQQCDWGKNEVTLAETDAFMLAEGYQWLGNEYVERCYECSDKQSYPWADKLDPERVAAYMREHCPDGIVELAKLKATLGPVIKPEEIATAADLQAQVSPYQIALDQKIETLGQLWMLPAERFGGPNGPYIYPTIAACEHGQTAPISALEASQLEVKQVRTDYAAYVARIRANL